MTEETAQKKTEYTKISVYPDNAGQWYIRCKANGEQLSGEKLSPAYAQRYTLALAAKDKEKLAGLREKLAGKYFGQQIESHRTQKLGY